MSWARIYHPGRGRYQPWDLLVLVKSQEMWDLQFKMENHAELSTVSTNSLDELFLLVHARHLTNAESVILSENLANFFQVLVTAGTTGVVFVSFEDSSI